VAAVNLEPFRQQRARDIETLASILERELICLDTSSLRSAAEQCRRNLPAGKTSWGYDVAPFRFTFSAPKNTHPPGLQQCDWIIGVSVQAVCETRALTSRLTHIDFQLSARAEDGTGSPFHCAWHLDRHPPGTPSTVGVHPGYHFQHGGNKVDATLFGNLLLFDAPRLPHPPLDAILSVDFLLSNFNHPEWYRLRQSSPEYLRLVVDSQERFWKPYVSSLHKWWDHPTAAQRAEASLIWPQLIC